MIFKGLSEDNGWITVSYMTTWKYDYDFMLDAAQTIIDTDFESLQRVATAIIAGAKPKECLDEVKKAGNNLRRCNMTVNECGVLAISGISKTMEVPVQFMFYNQTNAVSIFCPIKEVFQKHGEHCFDNYMNSIEIKAYCQDTQRRTIENFIKR